MLSVTTVSDAVTISWTHAARCCNLLIFMSFPKALLLVSLISLSACSGKRNGYGDDSSVPADSTADVQTVMTHLTPLPDTTCASVADVTYKIEYADTLGEKAMSSLSDLYAEAPGHFTFRNGLFRDASFGGEVKGTPTDIVVDWEFSTGYDTRETSVGTWGGGTGWTGQPLYVEWPDSMMTRFRSADAVNENFGKKEIMVGSLASKVYFINFDNGKASREPIPVSNPVKGTISLDPTLNGNLYVGLGAPAERPFGSRVIDLFAGKVTYVHKDDPKAQRHWDAYDSSPLRVGQYLFWPGENGTIYKFLIGPGSLRLHSALRYTVGGAAPGIENSISVYRNYGFVGDNHGNILCINLSNMKPVWMYRLGDDIDATTVVTVEDGHPYIYASCEVDRQVNGDARFVKLDALNGTEIWLTKIHARRFDIGKKHFDGGYYASPLPGNGDCADLIFSNVVLNERTDSASQRQNGQFIALNRKDGSIAYRTNLRYYAWSSPVGFLNEQGKEYVLTADCSGNVYLIDGKSGEIITRKPVGANFESSPVVIGNSVVVGSRGDKIYRLSVR